eukprot:362592-Chlamydomonas_euryale.AAC.3
MVIQPLQRRGAQRQQRPAPDSSGRCRAVHLLYKCNHNGHIVHLAAALDKEARPRHARLRRAHAPRRFLRAQQQHRCWHWLSWTQLTRVRPPHSLCHFQAQH